MDIESSTAWAEKLRALEERVSALESELASRTRTGTPAETTAPAGSGPATPASGSPGPTDGPAAAVDPEAFWALSGLIEHAGPEGGVVYTGHLTPPGAESPVSWQMGLPASAFEELSFADAARTLTALGNPVRLALLQAIYDGKSTAAELSADDRFGTSGQVYHHLNALAGAGWLENSKRGRWRIPAQRIVPLLTLILIGTQ